MQIITKRPDGSIDVATVNNEPSMTQQQFKDECDINHIMRKYEQTGQISHLNPRKGVYADLSQINDYQSMLHTIQEAEEAFNSLPAKVRYKFGNDPSQLISYLQDSNNRAEAIELGLIEAKNDEQIKQTTNNAQQVQNSSSSQPAE